MKVCCPCHRALTRVRSPPAEHRAGRPHIAHRRDRRAPGRGRPRLQAAVHALAVGRSRRATLAGHGLWHRERGRGDERRADPDQLGARDDAAPREHPLQSRPDATARRAGAADSDALPPPRAQRAQPAPLFAPRPHPHALR
eukprot:4591100-Prymnesium_polylepis.2